MHLIHTWILCNNTYGLNVHIMKHVEIRWYVKLISVNINNSYNVSSINSLVWGHNPNSNKGKTKRKIGRKSCRGFRTCNQGLWGDVTVTKIATMDNLADPLTKALPQKCWDCAFKPMSLCLRHCNYYLYLWKSALHIIVYVYVSWKWTTYP